LVSAIFLMPAAGPLMRALFPDDPRPVYTRASFFELTLAHIELVALSSLAAATIGIGLGIFFTRESGRKFAAIVNAIRRTARHGGGSLFRLAGGFRASRRNAPEVNRARFSGRRQRSEMRRRGFAEAPAPSMWTCLVVLAQPCEAAAGER
jgi:hypothetical protein